MPRISREQIKTVSFFHIMTQGINKEYIFENKTDKIKYEKLILQYKEEFNITILAYCIMDNHTHILIRIKTIENMSMFMHKINTQYAIYYNKKYNRIGYVFKSRYKSQMIDSLKHLYRCIDYIHDNPVKAKICKNRNQYRFSSFTQLYQNTQEKVIEALEKQLVYDLKDKDISENEDVKQDIVFLEDTNEDKKYVCEKEIEKYIQEKQIDKANLLKNKDYLRQIVIRLKDKNISYRIIAEKLEIGRETLRKLHINPNR